MAKPKTVWLGSREGFFSYEPGGYELGKRKTTFDPEKGFRYGDYIIGFCSKDFERITGFALKPGEVKKVRIIIEEV